MAEACQHALCHPPHIIARSDIAQADKRLDTMSTCGFRNGLRLCLVGARMDDNVTPGTRQAECDRAPDIPTRAGDQCLPSLHAHQLVPRGSSATSQSLSAMTSTSYDLMDCKTIVDRASRAD